MTILKPSFILDGLHLCKRQAERFLELLVSNIFGELLRRLSPANIKKRSCLNDNALSTSLWTADGVKTSLERWTRLVCAVSNGYTMLLIVRMTFCTSFSRSSFVTILSFLHYQIAIMEHPYLLKASIASASIHTTLFKWDNSFECESPTDYFSRKKSEFCIIFCVIWDFSFNLRIENEY